MIIFYDIPSSIGLGWSPNTWKTKYLLNYKRIPYKTEWVEYPDIEAKCKEIGADPTENKADGSPFYTLPVIQDLSTGAIVSDSAAIAEYLDEKYPTSPPLFPPGTKTFQYGFLHAHRSILGPFFQFIMPATLDILNPPSFTYFMDNKFGPNLKNTVPTGKEREEVWAKFKENFGLVDFWLQKSGGQFCIGDDISFCDFSLASYVIWLRIVWGEESAEWKEFKTWHGGRWSNLLKALEKYE